MRLPFGFGTRAEPPAVPQQRQRVPQVAPRNLTPVAPSGDSWREHRLADQLAVDPWNPRHLYFGMQDGGMSYGPPPRPAYRSFEIPRIFRGSMDGWAGLQQRGFVQDQRGSPTSTGYGAYIPHPPFRFPGRGLRSISMIRRNTGFKGANNIHVPALFVPTAPLS